jgi:hypothetical protein
VLICDAQYFADELRGAKRGWGHGSWQDAARLAKKAGVKQLILFHHDHMRTDDELDQLLGQARREFPHTLAASEGMVMDVARGETRVGSRRLRLSQRMPAQVPVEVETRLNGRAVREQVQPRTSASTAPTSDADALRAAAAGRADRAPAGERQRKLHWKRPARRPESCGGASARLRLRSEPATLDSGWRGVAVHFPGQPAGFKPGSH